MTIQTMNPATGQLLQVYAEMTPESVTEIITHTHSAWLKWQELTIAERGKAMQRLVTIMEQKKHIYAAAITQEMGKPITAAIAELDKCQWVCRYYTDHAEAMQLLQRLVQ